MIGVMRISCGSPIGSWMKNCPYSLSVVVMRASSTKMRMVVMPSGITYEIHVMVMACGCSVRVATMTVRFLVIVREWVSMSYLIVSMPPMGLPVMCPTMRPIVVWRVMMARMVVMGRWVCVMVRSGVMVPGMVMSCGVMASKLSSMMFRRCMNRMGVVNVLLRMRMSPCCVLVHI